MKKFTTATTCVAALVGSLALGPAPAIAQDAVAEVIVYGTDPCPRSTDDAIYVCNRLPESERYRIPPRLRDSGPPQVRESWAQRARSLETVGNTGTFSCSPVGPGGHTGCLSQVIREAREQRRRQAEELTAPEN